ncbi:hypothetical protein [Fodinibius sp. AD559]|uniref:hypothetical protein n=1 Tax=Fodinibius sp. AD559 TaxID=3424179 RepID=UPI0040468912
MDNLQGKGEQIDGTGNVSHNWGYLALALLMTVIAIGGFWQTYWWPVITGNGEFHWLLHLHGAAFTLWMVLLIIQTSLVWNGQTQLHQLFGKRLGIFWGILIILLGIAVGFGRVSPAIATEYDTLAEFIKGLPIPLGDILVFAILFSLGIFYRSKPELHKRLMILSTTVLLFAPAGRLSAFAESVLLSVVILLGIPLLPAFLAIGYDWWTRERVHPAYWWGTALIALRGASIIFFAVSETWATMAETIAQELRSVLLPLL